MDSTTLFTILGFTVGSSLMVIIAMFSIFLWLRSEASDDRRNLESKIDENARETRGLIEAIRLEIKDFHGRLCAIEEGKKYRNMARKDRKWYG